VFGDTAVVEISATAPILPETMLARLVPLSMLAVADGLAAVWPAGAR
jgi:hypothetical protein